METTPTLTDTIAGLAPTLRAVPAREDSALWCALVGVTVIALLCLPVFRRLLAAFLKCLFRRHGDSVQPDMTFSERLIVGVCLLQTLVYEGLILYVLSGADARPPLGAVGLMTLVAAAVMTVQFLGYRAVGFAFTSRELTGAWVHAFSMSQALAGYLLAPLAVCALVYPEAAGGLLIAAGAVYVGCRILLYIRAFGIFYQNYRSILEFFLYLCTLEIVPLLLAWVVSARILTLFR